MVLRHSGTFYLFWLTLFFPIIEFYAANPAVDDGEASTSLQKRRRLRGSALEDNKIIEVLLANYDKRIRPPSYNTTGGNGPVLVKVNILIRMLSKIDVVNMEYSMQITFRERWRDHRLAYDRLNLTRRPKFLTVPYIKSHIWLPDTFFPSEKSAHRHMIDSENMFFRLYGDGSILYSARLSLTCSCPMYLQLYPLDVQYCDFDLISYAHTTRDIMYEWDVEPIQLKPGVGEDLPNFHLEKKSINTKIECSSHTNTGTYACLRMRMKLNRLMTYFILQLYFPTTMIVIVSWVSFWIDMHSTAGRIALAMTTLLTITTMQSSINAKLPPVNYVKVIDVWLGTCQTFVFGALIEYAIVCYRDNKFRSEKSRKSATAIRNSQIARKALKTPIVVNNNNGKLSCCDEPGLAMCPVITDNIPQPMTDFYGGLTQYAVDQNAPCTCGASGGASGGLGGLGSAVLAGFGFLDPTLTTLVPMSIDYEEPDNGGGAEFSTIYPDHVPTNPLRLTAEHATGNWDSMRYSGGRRKQKKISDNSIFSDRSFSLKLNFTIPTTRSLWALIRQKFKKPDYLPARIDYYARILMPTGFLVFNVFYWGICLYMAAKQVQ